MMACDSRQKAIVSVLQTRELRLGGIKLWQGGNGSIVDGTQESYTFFFFSQSNNILYQRFYCIYSHCYLTLSDVNVNEHLAESV